MSGFRIFYLLKSMNFIFKMIELFIENYILSLKGVEFLILNYIITFKTLVLLVK